MSFSGREAESWRRGRRQWFIAAMTAVTRRLPFGLSRIVKPNLVGFAVINGGTFLVDLGLLTVLHSGFGWPLWVSLTVSYLSAFGLSFVLNRTLNFRSHGAVGPQLGVYVVVVAVNYLLWILGFSSGMTALGLEYHVARILAAGCEGVYMYLAMRFVVFREPGRGRSPEASADGPTAGCEAVRESADVD